MEYESFIERLNTAISNREFIIFGARCQVKYSGRAESFLPSGDRVIIIKNDMTMLVHQPVGNNPVNYMKQDTVHKAMMDDDACKLKSSNLLLKEAMDVLIEEIHFFSSHKLEDSEKLILAGTEQDMADMIMDNPSLIESGFKPMREEHQTKYGFVDVFGHDKEGSIVVIECKRYTASLDAVTQLRRYVEKVSKSNGNAKVRGMIAAPKITPNALKMLNDWGFEYRHVHPPKYLEEYKKNQKAIHDYFG